MKRTVFLLLVHILAINAFSSDPTIIRKRVSEVQMMVVATDSQNPPC